MEKAKEASESELHAEKQKRVKSDAELTRVMQELTRLKENVARGSEDMSSTWLHENSKLIQENEQLSSELKLIAKWGELQLALERTRKAAPKSEISQKATGNGYKVSQESENEHAELDIPNIDDLGYFCLRDCEGSLRFLSKDAVAGNDNMHCLGY